MAWIFVAFQIIFEVLYIFYRLPKKVLRPGTRIEIDVVSTQMFNTQNLIQFHCARHDVHCISAVDWTVSGQKMNPAARDLKAIAVCSGRLFSLGQHCGGRDLSRVRAFEARGSPQTSCDIAVHRQRDNVLGAPWGSGGCALGTALWQQLLERFILGVSLSTVLSLDVAMLLFCGGQSVTVEVQIQPSLSLLSWPCHQLVLGLKAVFHLPWDICFILFYFFEDHTSN